MRKKNVYLSDANNFEIIFGEVMVRVAVWPADCCQCDYYV